MFNLEAVRKPGRKNDEIWIKSPFSGEKTASLHMNPAKNVFKDFSSGKGGGVLNFCQELLRLKGQYMNCYETARWMLDNGISSVSINDFNNMAHSSGCKRIRDEKEKKESGKAGRENHPIRTDLRKYMIPGHAELGKRGISPKTCQYLGCGYLPLSPSGKASSPLNNRIVFQVRGVKDTGRRLKRVILTHVGRALTEQQEKADGKYWGFPFFKSLEIFNQDNLLLDPAARIQVEQNGLILAEGFFDAAKLIEAGCLNAGSVMGSQVTEGQVRKLEFIYQQIGFSKIVVFPDRDYPGINGAEKSRLLLRKKGFKVNIFNWEQSFIKKDGSHASIPETICDPCDMSGRQLQWLRRRKII